MSWLTPALGAMERGWIPDALIRAGIRHLCADRLRECRIAGADGTKRFLAEMCNGPIAPLPDRANAQHYELPPEFFALALGPRRKYSCCFYPPGVDDLATAEEAALAATCERAELADGQQILELGCGWGSLTLWMAERYPQSQITAVSNSAPQRRHIETTAASRGLTNVCVLTADMNDFAAEPATFDRVVSVEMFEHMRNYERLLERIAEWLRPDGKLFVHIFCHRRYAYPFESEGEENWMGRHFFTGGLMPSAEVFASFTRHLHVARQWEWDGTHYQRTSEAWLRNLDEHRREAQAILTRVAGPTEGRLLFHRWRVFYLAVAELFGYAGGSEWFVSHYLLEPTDVAAR